MNPFTPTVSLFWQRLSLKNQEPIHTFFQYKSFKMQNDFRNSFGV
jgi:hypothetical protein